MRADPGAQLGHETQTSRILKSYALIGALLLLTYAGTSAAGFTLQQSISVMTILVLISTTFLFWNRRLSFAFVGIGLLLAFKVIDIPHLLEYANIDIILFLISMMIFVGFLENNKFFEFVIGRLIDRIGRNGKLLLAALLLLAGLTAAIIDEVTSILIMMSVALHLAGRYKVSPVPLILMIIFATNIGSSATVVGNPVGVMVALNGGLSFSDFLRWATPISVAALAAAFLVFLLLFKGYIAEFDRRVRDTPVRKRADRMLEGGRLLVPTLLFVTIFLGLMFHAQVEKALHLEKNTMLIGFALIGAGVSMLIAREGAAELVERRVDWWTLMFFMFLFASVGSLRYTGVIDLLSGAIVSLTGSNLLVTILLVMLIGGLLSAVLDNVLAVAIMIPLIQDLAAADPASGFPLWWTMLFAGTFFGNLTPLGSTANIVALGIMQKRGMEHIGFGRWIRYGLLVTAVTAGVALLLIVLQLPLMVGGG